ncbi:MAG: GNAT family N-acetyltransferase, partial [Candidatus Thorarchaeota archaeon]|nr:GNAT family N-acetyltransferase [Candidatus Thorarchaeota archaeon]
MFLGALVLNPSSIYSERMQFLSLIIVSTLSRLSRIDWCFATKPVLHSLILRSQHWSLVHFQGSSTMLTIRQGGMRDCKDLLDVYMGAHWTENYTTVEQVKAAHRGIGFLKWGWLVADMGGRVVGEILFRIETNPVVGKIGVITDIGVDVRYQKKGLGKKLVTAAESALKAKKVGRLVATSPPDVYNFWMKLNWFARGSL